MASCLPSSAFAPTPNAEKLLEAFACHRVSMVRRMHRIDPHASFAIPRTQAHRLCEQADSSFGHVIRRLESHAVIPANRREIDD